MKKMSSIFLIAISLSLNAAELAEKDSGQLQQKESLKPMSKAVKDFVLSRIEYKKNSMQTLVALKNELTNKSDQDEINKIMATSGELNLTTGQYVNNQYIVDLGKFKIKIEGSGFVTGEIKINEKVLNINNYKSLSEFLAAVDEVGNSELNKTSSLIPQLFGLIIPSAHAAISNGKYVDILKVNSAGVVFLTLNKMALWRKDHEDFRKLLSQIEKDVREAIGQCESQAATIGVSGDSVKVYGVLNDATRKTLQSIVDKSKDEITEDRVLAGLFTKYAAKENHGQKAQKNLTCLSFLGPFGRENMDFKHSIEANVCPDVEKLTACLGNLYSSDQRVSNIARNEVLKKFSGERFESDTDYLNQMSTSSK